MPRRGIDDRCASGNPFTPSIGPWTFRKGYALGQGEVQPWGDIRVDIPRAE